MERIDRRTLNRVPLKGCVAVCPLMRSKVRAYSHQGHGPRADQQAGYISATSDGTPSIAKSSRSIHVGQLLPNEDPALIGWNGPIGAIRQAAAERTSSKAS